MGGALHIMQHCRTYLFFERDLREIVDGAIVSCEELTREISKIATILCRRKTRSILREEIERERERERELTHRKRYLLNTLLIQ